MTLVGAGAAVVVLAVPAFAAASSTTVSPAGDNFTASLAPGTTADFTVGNITVSCNTSDTGGQIPLAPGNHNDAGPVTMPITTPTFANDPSPCPTNEFFVDATNTTSGAWSIAIQFVPADPTDPTSQPSATGTLSVPQGGVVTHTTGIVCTVTVAPDAPTTITGTLHPASGSTPPQLVFSDAMIPIQVSTGAFCPSAQTAASFNATYDLLDTTDPNQDLTVTG
ncbi:MAG TPA: hypothetical protein VFX70_15955 [Mycobacteriales bacterium]|nr:hypothetical protein [Mycobacteriales bacterium]